MRVGVNAFETHWVSAGSCGPPRRHQTGPPSPGDWQDWSGTPQQGSGRVGLGNRRGSQTHKKNRSDLLEWGNTISDDGPTYVWEIWCTKKMSYKLVLIAVWKKKQKKKTHYMLQQLQLNLEVTKTSNTSVIELETEGKVFTRSWLNLSLRKKKNTRATMDF